MTMVLAPGEPSIRQSWLWKGSEGCCLWGCLAFPGSASLRIHSNLGCFFPTTENPSSLKWKAWDKALPKLGGILTQGLICWKTPLRVATQAVPSLHTHTSLSHCSLESIHIFGFSPWYSQWEKSSDFAHALDFTCSSSLREETFLFPKVAKHYNAFWILKYFSDSKREKW